MLNRNIHYNLPSKHVDPRATIKKCQSLPTSFKDLNDNYVKHLSKNLTNSVDGLTDKYISKDVVTENILYNIDTIYSKCYSKTLDHETPGVPIHERIPNSYTQYHTGNLIQPSANVQCYFPGGSVVNGILKLNETDSIIYEHPIRQMEYIKEPCDMQIGPIRVNHGIERIWNNVN